MSRRRKHVHARGVCHVGAALVLSALLAPAVCAAEPAKQVIYLKDGSVVKGEVVESLDGTLVFRTESGVLSISNDAILRIEYVPSSPTVANPQSSPSGAPAAETAVPARIDTPRAVNTPPAYFNVDILVGSKRASSDWAPIETQGEFGIQTSLGPSKWPGALAFEIMSSYRAAPGREPETRKIDYTGSSAEYAFGVRLLRKTSMKFRPQAGFGVSYIDARYTAETSSGEKFADADSAFGIWAGAALQLRLGRRVNVGLSARYSAAEIELFGAAGNAGGFHAGITVGAGFGSAVGMGFR